MTEDNNDFEDNIRDRLSDHEEYVPPYIWDNIVAKQEKRRFFWLFRNSLNIFLAIDTLMLIALGAGTVFSLINSDDAVARYTPKNNAPVQTTYTAENNHISTTPVYPAETKHASANKSQAQPIVINQPKENKTVIKTKKKEDTSVEESKAVADVSFKATENKTVKNSQTTLYASTNKKESTLSMLKNNNELDNSKPNIQYDLMDTKSAYEVKAVNNYSNIKENNSALEELPVTYTKAKRKNKPVEEIKEATQHVVPSKSTNNITADNVTAKKQDDKNQTAANKDLADANGNNGNADVALPSSMTDTIYKKKRRNPFAFDLVFSPDYAGRKITSSDKQYNDFVTKRDSAEKVHFAFSSAFRVNCFITKNFYFQTGISYSQRQEKYALQTKTYTNEMYVDSSKYITHIDPMTPPRIVRNYDTLTYVKTNYKHINADIFYRSWDIPFVLGYRISGKNAGISFQGGIAYNISFKQAGTYINPDSLTTVNVTNVNPYKPTMGISVLGGIVADFRLANHLSLLFEPSFRYGLTNVTNTESPVSMKFYTYSINAGIRYKFN